MQEYLRGQYLETAKLILNMRGILAFLLVFAVHPLHAQEPASEPRPLPAFKPVQTSRFVPSGEDRTLVFLVALFPDCSSRGPTVARLIEKPTHGEITFKEAQSFPSYTQTSVLVSCNTKKVPGLMINYKSELEYTGEDKARFFVIFPDGSGNEWDVTLIVK